jgi:hypothetical protein
MRGHTSTDDRETGAFTCYRRPLPLVAVVLCCLGAAPAICVAADSPRQPVSAGQDFSNPMFAVHSPNSEGWQVFRSGAGLSFGRTGANHTDSEVATVSVFSTPKGLSPEEFLSRVRDGLTADSASPQFQVVTSSVKLSTARAYTCVDYDATSIDHGKPQLFLPHHDEALALIALYCQYPDKPGLGFAVTFSHRGGQAPATFEPEARDFIASVQVTSASQPPTQTGAGKPR